jgi:hypothetical protein
MAGLKKVQPGVVGRGPTAQSGYRSPLCYFNVSVGRGGISRATRHLWARRRTTKFPEGAGWRRSVHRPNRAQEGYIASSLPSVIA